MIPSKNHPASLFWISVNLLEIFSYYILFIVILLYIIYYILFIVILLYIIYYILYIIYYILFIVYYILYIIYYIFYITYYIIYYILHIIYYVLYIIYYICCFIYYILYIIYCILYIIYHILYIIYYISYIIYYILHIIYYISYIICYILYIIYYILYCLYTYYIYILYYMCVCIHKDIYFIIYMHRIIDLLKAFEILFQACSPWRTSPCVLGATSASLGWPSWAVTWWNHTNPGGSLYHVAHSMDKLQYLSTYDSVSYPPWLFDGLTMFDCCFMLLSVVSADAWVVQRRSHLLCDSCICFIAWAIFPNMQLPERNCSGILQ